MTVEEDVAVMVKDTVAAFGRIDVLVNNVGGNAAVTPFASSTPPHWRADLEINLMNMFYGTHAVLPHMLAQGSGRMINIGHYAERGDVLGGQPVHPPDGLGQPFGAACQLLDRVGGDGHSGVGGLPRSRRSRSPRC